jgi:uncharacterized membrane protein YhhN
MLLLALHTHQLFGYRYFVIGALLFALSDSILAINKFHTSIHFAGVLIMLTYGLAQLFLVKGIVQNSNTELADK